MDKRRNAFWIALATPGVLWLAVLFVIPFYAVLAHTFLNYMLDLPNVLENISWNGYMQPLTGVTPQVLVKEQILPPSLISTAVRPSTFRRGLFELQLPVDADALWQQAWLVVSNGM